MAGIFIVPAEKAQDVRWEDGGEGFWGARPTTAHKQTHHLGHKMSFLRVENIWIIGAKKWTE